MRLLSSLGIEIKKHIEILKVNTPATRTGGVKVESAAALLDKLQHEAKVL